jgi:hypothetical protein
MPNGMQGYAATGGFNQRRVDAFVNIVRDPRLVRSDRDAQVTRARHLDHRARPAQVRVPPDSLQLATPLRTQDLHLVRVDIVARPLSERCILPQPRTTASMPMP